MNNIRDNKGSFKGDSLGLNKKTGKKISLNLHIMPHNHESKDVRVFSFLVASLLIVIGLIIFLTIYV